ncbi:CDP-diacylglycerol--serine O-phosphatidyltransferase [Blochmannia endosymbiont of Polyrhachis (Hedomyrma) turneri]|uniref:CDP-diacylglycerol--serine O-phosphatidyltransferase n=1 Tax=Blochmannia endosymbiont of Polyrhachis (Hedomyrma) turneri TaxID=1505596 RepID=UPI00061A67BE|nr:CDP-diacylglycerol--serine O-phosphatidyltransferase [Blochmannia endosymbiont of Polyrhachis (Hedomyrma) turneri]AKC60111.1 CDP-diacylglycerol-serine O-phosphatidyltransferase [Blochmannia endosymbiont of Polyrhachis (Hedomyrma) turneri]
MIIINNQQNIFHNKHEQYLASLPKIAHHAKDIHIIHSPKEFKIKLLNIIKNAKNHIYLTTLYLEQDQAGKEILNTLFQTKKNQQTLKIIILVDWHRAQRGRIGTRNLLNTTNTTTNADWYYDITKNNPNIHIPIYGIPINIQEVLGVLHLKGFIIDNTVIYSGANINNVYLHQENKYRYDRYHIIHNHLLANTMINYLKQHILHTPIIYQLNQTKKTKKIKIKHNQIRLFRQSLKKANYSYQNNQYMQHELTITPIAGVGKKNLVNQTIHHLICSTKNKIIICTPYFNISKLIMHNILNLLQKGKNIEIIVGDKTANDFYASEHQTFNIINILPYLYEINLRSFLKKLQIYLDNKQLTVKIWKHVNNGYHLKGIWVDQEWQLLTSNNLNPRAWNLDLENAILIHDPKKILLQKTFKELNHIYKYTTITTHYTKLQDINDYPPTIRKLIKKIKYTHLDKIINKFF